MTIKNIVYRVELSQQNDVWPCLYRIEYHEEGYRRDFTWLPPKDEWKLTDIVKRMEANGPDNDWYDVDEAEILKTQQLMRDQIAKHGWPPA